MEDLKLADCLDEVLRVWQVGERSDIARLRATFAQEETEGQVVDFFVELCRAADDWRTPITGQDNPETLAEMHLDTPSVVGAPLVPRSTFGRYEIQGRVAAGGMGTVYRAYDPTLRRVVALKVPHLDPDHPRYENLADQFVQEARLAASVDHPNVCSVFDAGRHDGTPFVVMAFVEGETLASRLKTKGRFEDVANAVALTRQIAEGLAAAHAKRIVHRDIKPGNILLRASDQRPLLTDFGLARIAEQGGGVTQPGIVAGTIAYMAPEQAAGKAKLVGPHTDVYAMGVVLYQMVTGRLPFEGTVPTILDRIRTAQPESATHHRQDLPAAVDGVIRKAMAKNPRDRYPDASALALELGRVAKEADWASPATVTFTAPSTLPKSVWNWRSPCLAALLVAMILGAFWLGWEKFAAPTSPLEGELFVRVSTDPGKLRFDAAARPKVNVLVDDQARHALPVRNIDLVTLEVRFSRPAYAYLLWFPGEGGPPTPLFPWDPHPQSGFREMPKQIRVTAIRSPPIDGKGWPIAGPSGLETAVVMAREEPLTDQEFHDLQAQLGTLPPTPLGPDLQECAWLDPISTRGTLRGLNTAESRDLVDEPVFNMLRRLKSRFPFIKAVRFAHVGDALETVPSQNALRKGG